MNLLNSTTNGAASTESNEIHPKLDNCQVNRISVDTSGLLATWPEFGAGAGAKVVWNFSKTRSDLIAPFVQNKKNKKSRL